MAAPNLINANTINGRTSVLPVTTTANTILSNSAASGKCLKVNLLIISNLDTSNTVSTNVDIYRNTTPYRIANNVSIPSNASFDVFSNRSFYLEEGDSLRLTASVNSKLEAVCSYEEIV
jgi:hypothetical protein